MAPDAAKRQVPTIKRSVIEWLLDSDPSIRWQVMRDLTDASAEEVAAERARVATEGVGRAAARPPGDRRAVGRRGVEPRVELHDARPDAAARDGSRSRERPGAYARWASSVTA